MVFLGENNLEEREEIYRRYLHGVVMEVGERINLGDGKGGIVDEKVDGSQPRLSFPGRMNV